MTDTLVSRVDLVLRMVVLRTCLIKLMDFKTRFICVTIENHGVLKIDYGTLYVFFY